MFPRDLRKISFKFYCDGFFRVVGFGPMFDRERELRAYQYWLARGFYHLFSRLGGQA
jgi:hypothetical protein